nr:hypothetical protein [Tanacetum cinerariifolium]GFB57561.1 hypothetical protein [Tanacetum cinerariifolium]
KNPVFHGRCKHIGVKFPFLRDLVGKASFHSNFLRCNILLQCILFQELVRFYSFLSHWRDTRICHSGESPHWQYMFPLPVNVVPTARRLEMPLPGVCTAIEEMMKKLPVKDRWQLH